MQDRELGGVKARPFFDITSFQGRPLLITRYPLSTRSVTSAFAAPESKSFAPITKEDHPMKTTFLIPIGLLPFLTSQLPAAKRLENYTNKIPEQIA